ncbi:MAG TPA: radical SAM protein [Stellaceae bacterium]|nr:radical SAM protein [Stellaceae bacterium]
MVAGENRRRFSLVLIKPSHYDDDGYVIQWARSPIPSTTLANLYGLARDCSERRVLGEDVEIVVSAFDETNTRIRPERIAREIGGGPGLVGLVGVQSNEFPRAMDIARRLRAEGLQVCIGGFHVSGSIAMLPKLSPELEEAMALGISLFAGEAEGRFDEVLRDAWRGTLRPLYNYMDDLPNIAGRPPPVLPADRIRRIAMQTASFDAGRGCPFQCSFCTIINVQGRQSRRRSADDVEQIVRLNLAQGIDHFFITDDNFARNKDWESIFDRLGDIREREGLRIKFIIQVDTLCHRIPNFIAKAKRAGVTRVFIGLENINPDSLLGAKKRQNKITEYRKMLLEWRSLGITTYGGYILGFPGDTPETILRDIEIIQRELPIDMLEFFCLTPLPGSEDHQKLHLAGAPLDPDLNKYDLEHVTTTHPKMSKAAWEDIYQRAWRAYYAPEHLEKMMRRAASGRYGLGNISFLILWFYGSITIERVHPLQGGYFRRKYRRDRRPGLPREHPLVFYPRYAAEIVVKHVRLAGLFWRIWRLRKRVASDPDRRTYQDEALTPVVDDELDRLDLFTVSTGAKSAVAKARKEEQARVRIAG